MQAEDRVLSYITSENRPFNVQLVADMLAQFGVKKPQVQRAMDSLSESGKITCKACLYLQITSLHERSGPYRKWHKFSTQEFGKTKIYMPLQDGIETLGKGVRMYLYIIIL